MTFAQAAKLAVAALTRERRAWAPEANMLTKMGIRTYATERAARHYDALTEAIETLRELGKRPE